MDKATRASKQYRSGGKFPSCPFCGKSDLSVENLKSAWGTGDREDHVVCNNCAASAPVECWQERKLA